MNKESLFRTCFFPICESGVSICPWRIRVTLASVCPLLKWHSYLFNSYTIFAITVHTYIISIILKNDLSSIYLLTNDRNGERHYRSESRTTLSSKDWERMGKWSRFPDTSPKADTFGMRNVLIKYQSIVHMQIIQKKQYWIWSGAKLRLSHAWFYSFMPY